MDCRVISFSVDRWTARRRRLSFISRSRIRRSRRHRRGQRKDANLHNPNVCPPCASVRLGRQRHGPRFPDVGFWSGSVRGNSRTTIGRVQDSARCEANDASRRKRSASNLVTAHLTCYVGVLSGTKRAQGPGPSKAPPVIRVLAVEYRVYRASRSRKTSSLIGVRVALCIYSLREAVAPLACPFLCACTEPSVTSCWRAGRSRFRDLRSCLHT
ncbi:hypothetical protein C8Q79DRAFT_10812 [Trametes meyenii]|nr:hypothetical protein C8Q79DRAFT_10812 [Trametes meyenii]